MENNFKGEWCVGYDNDAKGGGFVEWYDVTNSEINFRTSEETDAVKLRETLNTLKDLDCSLPELLERYNKSQEALRRLLDDGRSDENKRDAREALKTDET